MTSEAEHDEHAAMLDVLFNRVRELPVDQRQVFARKLREVGIPEQYIDRIVGLIEQP